LVVQAEIHRKSISDKVEDRRDAADRLRINFADLPDKGAAWEELHRLTRDKDDNVRRRAANALGSSFPHIPDKESAWQDLIRLTGDEDIFVRWGATIALSSAFSHIPNKESAWQDLIWLTGDQESEVRGEAADSLGSVFSQVPDKESAWQDLVHLTGDQESEVRWGAANALGSAFSYVPDKRSAWEDLIRLTGNQKRDVRSRVVNALGFAFSQAPDKKTAWCDLIRLTDDEDCDVRWWAVGALSSAFSHVPEKDSAWKDLIRLTGNRDTDVRWRAVNALSSAFLHVPEKDSAWQDLLRLTGDECSLVRWWAGRALGAAFLHVPDKDAAWEDLHRLTSNEDGFVRLGAAEALGAAFPHVPDKGAAWVAMVDLSEDHEHNVRASANHSLGKASIFKATEAECEEDFRRDLENALQYFERSTAEASFSDPAKFCLPFYRSFYTLTCKIDSSEAEVENYLKEARDASRGSKSKEDLLEAVVNLSNALKEAQGLRGKNLYDLKRDLRVYSQYCNRFAELLEDTEDKAPRTVKLLRIGGRRVDKQIKETIAEIQEVARELCQMTVGTDVEPLGREVNQQAREISSEDYLKSEKRILRIAEILEDMCDLLPPQKREHASELVEEIQKCCNLEDRIIRLEAAINYIQLKIDIERYGKQFEYIKSELDEIKHGMKELQQKILDRLDENEKAIISTILSQSDKEQMDEILDLVKQVLSAIQHRELRGTVTSDDLNHLSKVVDDTRLKAADKLKVTLPLIPYFLQYEHEITLEKGVNLSAAWQCLVNRGRSKKCPSP